LKKKGLRLFLTVQGNGFLHHMVRNMAGTLIEVGKGSISLEQFQDLFVKRDRRLAGFTAPAHGLVLLKVQY
jgi:tRNA pseudouridine38-40 synthase